MYTQDKSVCVCMRFCNEIKRNHQQISEEREKNTHTHELGLHRFLERSHMCRMLINDQKGGTNNFWQQHQQNANISRNEKRTVSISTISLCTIIYIKMYTNRMLNQTTH